MSSTTSAKGIIFDFDGVLQDTFQFHRNKIKEFAGVDVSEKDFRNIHDGNFFENKHDPLSGVDWLKYRDSIHQELSLLRINSETKQALLELHERYNLFIVSSNGTKNIVDYLSNNNLGHVFKEILGLEFHRSKIGKFEFILKKYRFKDLDCTFVTDTLGDILEANKVNLRTIAVDFGFHDRKTLLKGNPFKIISAMESLPAIIDQI